VRLPSMPRDSCPCGSGISTSIKTPTAGALVTGGTGNHIVLLDAGASFGLTGRQAESALLDAGAVTNRNSVPRAPTAPGTPPASDSAPR
jgi:glycine/serine hydroxymethyltransferase